MTEDKKQVTLGEAVKIARERYKGTPPSVPIKFDGDVCQHDYEEVSGPNDYDGETYECKKCGHRYRLYYDEMR